MITVHTAIAPSAWASALINGDWSGIEDPQEARAIRAWVARMGWGYPVSCEDAGFRRSHDAWAEMPLGADCQLYTFLHTEPDVTLHPLAR